MSVTHQRNNTIWRKKEHYFISLKRNKFIAKMFSGCIDVLNRKEFSYNYVCKYLSKVNILLFNIKLNI